MHKFIILLGFVNLCRGSGWDFGGHGITLGEISLDSNHQSLPPITLDNQHGHSFGHGAILSDISGWLSTPHFGHHGHHVIPIGVPVLKKAEFQVPQLNIENVPQPYPVPVVVPKPVPYEVIKPVFQQVEKKVPTPVEKIVPVKVEKLVPYEVVRHVPVPVEKRIPIKIPIFKTIVHRSRTCIH